MKRSREPDERLELDPPDADSPHLADADVDLRPVSKIAGLDSAVEDEEAGSSAGSQSQAKESRRRANTLEKEASQPDNKSQPPQPSTTADKGKSKPEKADTDMADLTGAMSALQFVPTSVRFGRGRAGFSKR
ncbi:hypothetical protein ACHAPX_000718 [Trichoderma viride]